MTQIKFLSRNMNAGEKYRPLLSSKWNVHQLHLSCVYALCIFMEGQCGSVRNMQDADFSLYL